MSNIINIVHKVDRSLKANILNDKIIGKGKNVNSTYNKHENRKLKNHKIRKEDGKFENYVKKVNVIYCLVHYNSANNNDDKTNLAHTHTHTL